MRPKTFLVILALSVVSSWAGDLPTFEDFRRVDRTRKLTGQMQTADLLTVSHIDPDLILGVVQQNTNDAQLVWGAAEVVSGWTNKSALFESALALTTNNVAIANRYAAAAARQGANDVALQWARFCEEKDSDNTAPWLVELWVRRTRKEPVEYSTIKPLWAATFRDYSVEASLARIRLLEKAGYSAYSARRLGFKPDSDMLTIAREMIQPPIADATKPLLKEAGAYLQLHHPFLLSELVGQTLERAVLMLVPDPGGSTAVRMRLSEMDQRREELKQLYGKLDQDGVDYATEEQMVEYFNDMLALGEEAAMKKLATTVRRPVPPASSE